MFILFQYNFYQKSCSLFYYGGKDIFPNIGNVLISTISKPNRLLRQNPPTNKYNVKF